MEDPPEEAYGRVTNPERFAPLIPAAERLVADLERRFEVTVTRGPAAARPSGAVHPVDTMLITPSRADQAPLTVTTTSFPGLYLDVGAWQHMAFPSCGCDACDEHVDDAVADLTRYCTALAEGKLSERITGFRPTLEHAWDGDGWGSRGTLPLSAQRAAELRAGAVRPPEDGHWRPWSPRT